WQREPLGMSHVRQIMDRENDRDPQPERRRVRRREKDIEVIGGGDWRESELFPPCVSPAWDAPGREASLVDADRRRLRGIEHELVLTGAIGNRPFPEQPGKIPADARRMSAELAGVDADPHVSTWNKLDTLMPAASPCARSA